MHMVLLFVDLHMIEWWKGRIIWLVALLYTVSINRDWWVNLSRGRSLLIGFLLCQSVRTFDCLRAWLSHSIFGRHRVRWMGGIHWMCSYDWMVRGRKLDRWSKWIIISRKRFDIMRGNIMSICIDNKISFIVLWHSFFIEIYSLFYFFYYIFIEINRLWFIVITRDHTLYFFH